MSTTAVSPLSAAMARAMMARYTPDQTQWHYEHGLLLQAIDAAGSGKGVSREYVRARVNGLIDQTGRPGGYRDNEFNLDQINPGKIVLRLYKDDPQPRYRATLDLLRAQLRDQPRTNSGGFWHKRIYPHQIWLDGLYMQAPFWAEYAATFGEADVFEDLRDQFLNIENKAKDPRTGLLYHGWDESRVQLWANPDTGCSPHFWSRAMGWLLMAIVDTLDWIPASNTAHADLVALFGRSVEPLLTIQHAETGLWYQVLDQGGRTGNYFEASGSAMYLYAMAKALRLKYLSAQPGLAAAVLESTRRAYRGIVEGLVSMDPDGPSLNNVCKVAGLGGKPYRDGSYAYYIREPIAVNDFKGVGPLILACLEMEALGEADPALKPGSKPVYRAASGEGAHRDLQSDPSAEELDAAAGIGR